MTRWPLLQGPAYDTCPVCTRTLPKALLAAHANACLDFAASLPQPVNTPASVFEAPGDAGREPAPAPCGKDRGAVGTSSAAIATPATPCSAPAPATQHASSSAAPDHTGLDNTQESAPELAQSTGNRPPAHQPEADRGPSSAQRGPREPANSAHWAARESEDANGPGVSAAGVAVQPQQEGPRAAPPAGLPAGGNALAELMRMQRQRAAAHNYFLELSSDGSWRWSWWQDGARGQRESNRAGASPGGTAALAGVGAAPATHPGKRAAGQAGANPGGRPVATWSGVMQVDGCVVAGIGSELGTGSGVGPAHGGSKQPKAAMRLLTNAASGVGGELGGGGNGPRYTGGVALLKSALQKNVRLGRIDQAHRCGSQGHCSDLRRTAWHVRNM